VAKEGHEANEGQDRFVTEAGVSGMSDVCRVTNTASAASKPLDDASNLAGVVD